MRSPGFVGKVPAHGDFVDRNLAPSVRDAWLDWLQRVLIASQRRHGARWQTHFLTSPVWRFAFAPGALSINPVYGVVLPSVDRVGRYFPLAAMQEVPRGLDPFAPDVTEWFDAVEDAALSALDLSMRVDALTARLASISLPSVPPAMTIKPRLTHSLWWASDAVSAATTLPTLYPVEAPTRADLSDRGST